MSDLSVYYWIKNNQRGAATLRTTYNKATKQKTYWASVTVAHTTKYVRINKYEYDAINDRAGNVKSCFVTHSNGRFTYNEHCVNFK